METLLEQIGLSKTEAKIYLAALELGASSAINIAKKAGLSRQMVYFTLDSLLEKGLVKQVAIGKKNYFKAVDPAVLQDLAASVSDKIAKAVPLLKAKQAENAAVPLITVYENAMAMREWYRKFMETAKAGDELLCWSGVSDWYEMDSLFYQKFDDFCTGKGVKTRVVVKDTPEGRKWAEKRQSQCKEYRFISQDWQSPGEKFVWRDQIIYISLKQNATNMIVIESAHLSAIEKFDFENMWQKLEGLPKE